jgi:ketosteroid isomerase-like protein
MNIKNIPQIYTAFKAKALSSVLALQAEDTEWWVAGPT